MKFLLWGIMTLYFFQACGPMERNENYDDLRSLFEDESEFQSDIVRSESFSVSSSAEVLMDTYQRNFDRYTKTKYVSAWGLGRLFEAELLNYKTSKNVEFLMHLADLSEDLIKMRSDKTGEKDKRFNRTTPTWLTTRYSCGKPIGWLVHATVMMRPLLEAHYILLTQHGDQLSNSGRTRLLKQIKSFSQTMEHFYNKDRLWRNGGMTFEWSSTPFNCQFTTRNFKVLPLNMVVNAGDVWHLLADIGSDVSGASSFLPRSKSSYRTFGDKVLTYVKSQIQGGPGGGYSWRYIEGGSVEDTAHGSLTLNYMVRNYQEKRISSTYIKYFIKTFHFLYNGSTSKVRSHLSLSYGSIGQKKYCKALGRWYGLIAYDRAVEQRIKTIEKKCDLHIDGQAMLDFHKANRKKSAYLYPKKSIKSNVGPHSGVTSPENIYQDFGLATLWTQVSGSFRKSGTALTACLQADFGKKAGKGLALQFRARHKSHPKLAPCGGSYCGTSPGFKMFLLRSNGTWKKIYSGKLTKNLKTYTVQPNEDYRYIYACRAGGGSSRDNIEMSYIRRRND